MLNRSTIFRPLVTSPRLALTLTLSLLLAAALPAAAQDRPRVGRALVAGA